MKANTILFDVGDTLIHYVPNYADLYRSAFDALGISVSAEPFNAMMREAYHVGLGMPPGQRKQARNKAVLAHLNLGRSVQDGYLPFLDEVLSRKQEIVLADDAISTLEALKNRGFRLAVVSNYSADLNDILARLNLYHLFETVVISDVVGVAKPDRRIMDIALDRLKAEKEECVYVCDQPSDVVCAHSAGIRAILVNNAIVSYDNADEDARIQTLSELLALL